MEKKSAPQHLAVTLYMASHGSEMAPTIDAIGTLAQWFEEWQGPNQVMVLALKEPSIVRGPPARTRK